MPRDVVIGLPIHKIRIEQIVIISEKTEIANAFLDFKVANSIRNSIRPSCEGWLEVQVLVELRAPRFHGGFENLISNITAVNLVVNKLY